MKVNIRKSAIKDLKKINQNDRRKIHSKISALSEFPNTSNIKKLTNFEPAYRLRVGNYRILFDVSEDSIEIGRVLHRKDSYK
ncbi:MAG: type II toxin-antitoxin system RelE/ParE family toxin [Candidatus Electrothrix sp. ATG1]|nr:type II toxin-antitoxin system RelE/ParE family toxin [Candidatus Electrothrix sp. ATG1]